MIQRRAAEPTQAQHDAVVAGGHGAFDTDLMAGATRSFWAPGALPSAARDTRTISLSLRAKTLFIAKAGCDQIVIRRMTFRVGSMSLARLISGEPSGDKRAMIRSPCSL